MKRSKRKRENKDVKDAQWSEYMVHWENGPSPVRYVSRRVSGRDWEPWVVVARSALLDELGIVGEGLYAAQSFKKDDVLGRYGGTVIGSTFPNRQSALRSREVRNLIESGRNMIVTRSVRPRGVEAVNGSTAGPPYLQKANDPRGTRHRPNARFTPGGFMKVDQSSIPAFDLEKPLRENVKSEIRWSYGDDYWATFNVLGTSVLPFHI